MEESVILATPALIVMFGIALALSVAGLLMRTGYVLPLVSAAISVAAVTYSLLLGAGMQEVLIVVLVFFAVHLISFTKGRKDK